MFPKFNMAATKQKVISVEMSTSNARDFEIRSSLSNKSVASHLYASRGWLTPTTRVPCSNAAKTRNTLTLGGMPQTTEPISAASGP